MKIFLMEHRRLLWLLLLAALLIAAAGLRFYELDRQSLWYDEGTSVGRAQRSLPDLIETMQANIHVPGYFALLAGWEDLAGASEFSLRAFSVFWSLLSIALTYALGQRLYGPLAGLAAASFVAFNSFSIYYAQEARMYAMLAAVVAASFWILAGFVRALSRPQIERASLLRWGAALAIINSVGVYTHYVYPLAMIAQGLLAAIWLAGLGWAGWRAGSLRTFGRALLVYVIANLLTIAAFLPWLPIALRQIGGHGNTAQPIPLDELLRIVQGYLAFGPTFEESMGGFGAVFYALLLFGLLLLPDPRPRPVWRMLLPLVWLAVLLAGFLVLDLYTRYLRFLTPAQIAVALWMGRGIWNLWHFRTRERSGPLHYVPRAAAAFALGAYLFTLAHGWWPLYYDEAYQRDDYRGLAAEIERELRPDDAIILSGPGLREIFGYYYDGAAPVYPLPIDDDTAAHLERIVADHPRIFAVYYGTRERDPQGSVEGTLSRLAFAVSDEWRDDMRLVRYVAPAHFAPAESLNARFGDSITLLDAALNATEFQPGDALQLRLRWTTDAPLGTRYKVFVQVLNPDGTLAFQRDSEPGAGLELTSEWQPGAVILDQHALLIPDLPAGEGYTLILGLYDLNDASARLPALDGDYLRLNSLRLLPR